MKRTDFILKLYLLLPALLFVNLPLVSFAENFCAWQLKTGHEGIQGEKLTFAEHSMTLEFWLNLDEGKNSAEKTTIAGTMDSSNKGFLIQSRQNSAKGNALEMRFYAQTPQKSNIVFFIPPGEYTGKWAHVAFVISETEGKAYFYLNGEPYATSDAPGGWVGNSNIALSIAKWYSDPKIYGKLADFRIWKTARTASEIKANYNKHLEGKPAGLVVNYRFAEYEREIANTGASGVAAQCNPSANWNLYHANEVLAAVPANFAVGGNTLIWGSGNTPGADLEIEGNYVIFVEPETQKNLRNPLTGWALYGSPGSASNFWTNLDKIQVPGVNTPVQIADYANTLYIRTSWTALNPSEGVYGWDTNSGLKWMIEEAQKRGMRLAFRVVVDSRDKSENFTPAYVKNAGAEGFTSGSNNQRWSPYPDDPIFQEKYEKFVEAFAKKFNDPDVVDFIDGFGLGLWGEAHNMKYKNYANRESVFKWVVDLYTEHFTKIPLAINYHRLIATEQSWGRADEQSETLLNYAFNKGYILRQDAFGMTDYYQSWEKNIAKKWMLKRPIIMEGGWVTNSHSWWNDPRGYETLADVRQGEFDDSKEARVNMMDFRVGEVDSWFQNSFNLVQEFIADGGYRLYPDRLSLPKEINSGSCPRIIHRWNNLGWGYCPTNIPCWNQKYKVAFGLLDSNNDVVATFIDEQTDLSTWLKGSPASYEFTPLIEGVRAGTYTWAVAIVDKTKNNTKGINISAKRNITSSGWLKLMEVTVK